MADGRSDREGRRAHLDYIGDYGDDDDDNREMLRDN